MDETRKQCVRETRVALPAAPGHPARYDAEYERNGVGHLLMYYAPFDDWRRADVAADHAASTWAEGVRRLVEDDFPAARRITLVMDNLNTHCGASLYKSFPPAKARALLDKLEFVYTPKHGSWLNMARGGVQRPGAAVPGSADSRRRHAARGSQRMDRRAQSDKRSGQLALYYR